MKKSKLYLAMLSVISMLVSTAQIYANPTYTIDSSKKTAETSNADISLYYNNIDEKMNLDGFYLKANDNIQYYRWKNIKNSTYYPKINLLNKNTHIAITLTTEYTKDSLKNEIHIINRDTMEEINVQDPVSFTQDNLLSSVVYMPIFKAMITDDSVQANDWYDNIGIGNIVKYKIADEYLTAEIPVSIYKNKGNAGYFTLKYNFDGEKYYINNINFIPTDKNKILDSDLLNKGLSLKNGDPRYFMALPPEDNTDLTPLISYSNANSEIVSNDFKAFMINGTFIPNIKTIDENNTTFLPLRAICEALGLGIKWNPEKNIAIITSPQATVSIGISSNYSLSTDTDKKLPILTVDGRIYVTLDFFEEILDLKTEYIDSNADKNFAHIDLITIDNSTLNPNIKNGTEAIGAATKALDIGLINFSETIKKTTPKVFTDAEIDNAIKNIRKDINNLKVIGSISRYWILDGPYTILLDKYTEKIYFSTVDIAKSYVYTPDFDDPYLFVLHYLAD